MAYFLVDEERLTKSQLALKAFQPPNALLIEEEDIENVLASLEKAMEDMSGLAQVRSDDPKEGAAKDLQEAIEAFAEATGQELPDPTKLYIFAYIHLRDLRKRLADFTGAA